MLKYRIVAENAVVSYEILFPTESSAEQFSYLLDDFRLKKIVFMHS
jgi:hypothetical protein